MAKSKIFEKASIFDAFHDIRKRINSGINNSVENYKWFRNIVNEKIKSSDRNQIRQQIITDPSRIANRFLLGNLYFFFYNEPEYKATLPFYDSFPLILLMHRKGDTIFGINFHYIPPKRRLSMFLELMRYTNNGKLTKGTRIILPYEKMKRDKKWKIFKSCFRRYKINKIQGNLINISAPDWPIAINLPVERFKKRGKKRIWKQTIREELS